MKLLPNFHSNRNLTAMSLFLMHKNSILSQKSATATLMSDSDELLGFIKRLRKQYSVVATFDSLKRHKPYTKDTKQYRCLIPLVIWKFTLVRQKILTFSGYRESKFVYFSGYSELA